MTEERERERERERESSDDDNDALSVRRVCMGRDVSRRV